MMPLATSNQKMVLAVKEILLKHEWTRHPGKNMPKVVKQVATLITGYNDSQWKTCSPIWRNNIKTTTAKLISTSYKAMIRLDLGCGPRKKLGYVGIDRVKFRGVDIVLDFTKEPLPFTDNMVDAIYSDHALEHLEIEDVVKLMGEIHRVCRNDAQVEIRVPHFSGFTNFYEYHKTSFRLNSFAEFLWEEGMYNSKAKFSLYSRKINLVNRQSPKNHAVTKWFFWNYPMEWLVNKMPRFYEMSGWRNIFPAWEIIFRFKVVK